MNRVVLIIFMTHEEPVLDMAVSSLLPQLGGDDALLVLHNGKEHLSFKGKYEPLPKVYYFQSDENLGVARGRKFLLDTDICRNADIIFSIDSDAIVPSDYLDRMTDFLCDHPEAGVVGPVVLDYSRMRGPLENNDVKLPYTVWEVTNSFTTASLEQVLDGKLDELDIDHIGTNPDWRKTYLYNPDLLDATFPKVGKYPSSKFCVSLKHDEEHRMNLEKEVGGAPSSIKVANVAGCCQVFRRSLVDHIATLYDLYSPYGYEDVDFCVQALEHGKTNYTTNSTYMLHKTDGRHSTRTTPSGLFEKRINDSRARTIFDYRWDKDDFPRNSYARILRRAFKHWVDIGQDFERVQEWLIAEWLGVSKALNQLAAFEGQKFGNLIKGAVDVSEGLSWVYRLIDERAAKACGLYELETYQKEHEISRHTRIPKNAGVNRFRYNVGKICDEKSEVLLGGRAGNTYPAIRQDVVSKTQTRRLGAFHNKHQGERCFIIGNGPSLKSTDFSLLRDEVTFAVNGIFYMFDDIGFVPTYYVVEDNHVVDDNLERILTYPAKTKFFPAKYASALSGAPGAEFLPTNWEFYFKSSKHFETPRFSTVIEDIIFVGQTVTYLNLQLASYMGFKEVVLVGVDFSYKVPETSEVEGFTITSTEDDPNHFHPAYFGKGKKWHFPKLENCEKAYRHSKAVYAQNGKQVLDATIGGKLDVFDKIDYFSMFDNPVKLDAPNAPSVYFVHMILQEELHHFVEGRVKADVSLSIDNNHPHIVDLQSLVEWWLDSSSENAEVAGSHTVDDCDAESYGTVRIVQNIPDDFSVEAGLIVLLSEYLLERDDFGCVTPSRCLSNLMEHYEYVVLHQNIALASNIRIPTFLKEDFGLSVEAENIRYPNVHACLAEANQYNTKSYVVCADIRTVQENILGLPSSSDLPELDDLSLVGALLDLQTPVLLCNRRMYFPR